MLTDTGTDNLSVIEAEFAKPCEGTELLRNDCDNQATWVMATTHGSENCPLPDRFVCDRCKQWFIDTVTIALTRNWICLKCQTPMTGQVSDHVKFIKL